MEDARGRAGAAQEGAARAEARDEGGAEREAARAGVPRSRVDERAEAVCGGLGEGGARERVKGCCGEGRGRERVGGRGDRAEPRGAAHKHRTRCARIVGAAAREDTREGGADGAEARRKVPGEARPVLRGALWRAREDRAG